MTSQFRWCSPQIHESHDTYDCPDPDHAQPIGQGLTRLCAQLTDDDGQEIHRDSWLQRSCSATCSQSSKNLRPTLSAFVVATARAAAPGRLSANHPKYTKRIRTHTRHHCSRNLSPPNS